MIADALMVLCWGAAAVSQLIAVAVTPHLPEFGSLLSLTLVTFAFVVDFLRMRKLG